jgi:teichuronic acid biosynthesis glycosyltransferase TuaG
MPPHIPTFSIVTPVYNASRLIDRFVESLYSQTFSDWELIVVDDDSSDDSAERLLLLLGHDPRVKLLSTKTLRSDGLARRGPYLPRNLALEHCTGKYVCFWDIDDVWVPDKLQLQSDLLILKPKTKLLFSSYYRVSPGGQVRLRSVQCYKPLHFWINFINPIPMLTATVLRESIRDHFFEPVGHEDYLFWLRFIKRLGCGEVFQVPRPLAFYYVGNQSVSSNKIKALAWIYVCHRLAGRSRFRSILFVFCRVLIFVVVWLSDGICIGGSARQAFSSIRLSGSRADECAP